MGRAPCCDKANVKKGPWSPEEDSKLKEYIEKNGTGGNWIALPHKAGLRRCGKSCRLRWLNYLRPNLKHGEFSDDEDRIICTLFASIGSRWSIIAAQLPGRTDNDIKNYWNTKLKKKLLMGTIPSSSSPIISKPHHHPYSPQLSSPSPSSTSSSLHAGMPSSTSSSSSSSSSSSMYQCSPSTGYYYYEQQQQQQQQQPISALSSFLNNTSISCTASHHMLSSFLNNNSVSCTASHQQVRDSTSNLFMLGATTTATTSSSSHQDMGFQGYYCNNGEEEGQKFMVSSNEGLWGGGTEMPLMDYGLEEIKQLINTTNNSNNVCNGISFDQEIKTEMEGVVYL